MGVVIYTFASALPHAPYHCLYSYPVLCTTTALTITPYYYCLILLPLVFTTIALGPVLLPMLLHQAMPPKTDIGGI